MFGSEYFFETAKLEILPDDPSANTAGRIWFNLRTKEFKYSILDNNNKIVTKVLPTEIVLLNLLQDLSAGTSSGGNVTITQQVTDNATVVPSSKAVYDELIKTKYKKFNLTTMSLEYTLNHNLNSQYLHVYVFDQNNINVYPKVTILNNNSIKITFTEAINANVTVVAYT